MAMHHDAAGMKTLLQYRGYNRNMYKANVGKRWAPGASRENDTTTDDAMSEVSDLTPVTASSPVSQPVLGSKQRYAPEASLPRKSTSGESYATDWSASPIANTSSRELMASGWSALLAAKRNSSKFYGASPTMRAAKSDSGEQYGSDWSVSPVAGSPVTKSKSEGFRASEWTPSPISRTQSSHGCAADFSAMLAAKKNSGEFYDSDWSASPAARQRTGRGAYAPDQARSSVSQTLYAPAAEAHSEAQAQEPVWLTVVDGRVQAGHLPKPGHREQERGVWVEQPLALPPGLYPEDVVADTQQMALGCQLQGSSAIEEKPFLWHVDARKLQSSENVIVSPQFTIDRPSPATFRVMLCPEDFSYSTRRVSFMRSKGVGKIQIKSEVSLQLAARIEIVVGDNVARLSVDHDFAESGVCAFPDRIQFVEAVDAATKSLPISVRIVPFYAL
eukprot:TRINITY_DN2715_c0_g1_i1.p1 TRINITY_DN2715_c0_g1~~TRINITY_DN2715_c0_g1_i1.p1  ORF type:complete len:445 (-),score=80.17 TRINITY_DN2715_c0_g1_i1:824-2158(-)